MVVTDRHHPPRSGGPAVKRLAAGTRRLVREALQRDPGDRWAAVFGRIAGYSFAVAVVTGVLLLPFFHPSMAPVAYHGSYSKLDGLPVSQAYRSVLAITGSTSQTPKSAAMWPWLLVGGTATLLLSLGVINLRRRGP